MAARWGTGVGTRSRSAQVARNALAGAGSRLAMMAVGFALTPYVVHHLGLRLFGLWSLTGAIAGYLGLLDFGLAGVFVKFVSEYGELGRRDLIRQVVTFGAIFYAAFGLALALPIALVAPLVAGSFGLPPSETHTAIWVFEALAAQLVLTLIAGLPGTVVIGFQRMEIASRNGAAAYLASAGATVVLLHAGWGIAAVVVAAYVQLACGAALQYFSARRIFGPIWWNPLRFERALLQRMFSYGGWTQLTQVLTIASLDVGRFVAAATVGLVSVSFYELGARLAYLSRSFPGYLLDAIMPAAAAADARAAAGDLDRMYVSGTLYTVFATCGIAGFFVGAGDLLVRVWMGDSYGAVSGVLIGLCAGHVFASVTGVGMTVLRASGKPRYEAYSAAVTLAVNFAVTALLVRPFGLLGIVAGTAAGWFAGAVYFTLTFHRLHPAPWWRPVGMPALRAAGTAAAVALPLSLVVHAVWTFPILSNRLGGALVLAISAVAYGSCYVGLSILAGVWRADPSRLLNRVAERGRLIGRAGLAR